MYIPFLMYRTGRNDRAPIGGLVPVSHFRPVNRATVSNGVEQKYRERDMELKGAALYVSFIPRR